MPPSPNNLDNPPVIRRENAWLLSERRVAFQADKISGETDEITPLRN